MEQDSILLTCSTKGAVFTDRPVFIWALQIGPAFSLEFTNELLEVGESEYGMHQVLLEGYPAGIPRRIPTLLKRWQNSSECLNQKGKKLRRAFASPSTLFELIEQKYIRESELQDLTITELGDMVRRRQDGRAKKVR